jgi:hypothetical protein
MKVIKGSNKEIEILAEDEYEEALLHFIEVLNETGGFEPLLNLFMELIDKGVLKRYDGSWIWSDDWEVIKDLKGYA